MKRQRGRNRGGGGGNKPQQHNANRAFDSNGPEGIKVRGNAQHVYDKYQQLARDAAGGGDRILAENYLQHAEHYFRLIRATQPNRAVADIVGRDTYASGYDIDFEDESGAQAFVETEQPEVQADNGGDHGQRRDRDDRYPNDRPREDRQRDDRPRDDRPRDDRNGGRYEGRDRYRDRDDCPRDDRNGDRPREDRYRDDRPREDRPRDDRPRDDRPREDRPREDRPRDDRPREDRPRDDRPREERGRDRFERRNRDDRPREDRPAREERDPLAVVEPQATPLPRREEGPRLRSSEGDESHAPAFLRARPAAAPAPAEAAAEEAPKPKRRTRKPAGETAAEEA